MQAGVAAPTFIVNGRPVRKARRSELFDYGGPSGDGKLVTHAEYMKHFWKEVQDVKNNPERRKGDWGRRREYRQSAQHGEGGL